MENNNQQIVTPFETKCDKEFNYDKIIKTFGCEEIDNGLISRFEKVTKKPIHPWIRRKIFFAHRELNKILDDYEDGKQIYIYTGRGPSSQSLHLGHIIPFMFTKWLQDVFDAIVVIQIADDEKFYFKNISFEKIYSMGYENAKDIIACGFNPKKTFIFSNHDYSWQMNNVIRNISKKTKMNVLKNIFGLTPSDNIGKFVWPIHQTAAAFSQSFPSIFKTRARCLIPCAIDQDPYFRLARTLAPRLKYLKPSSIMTKFLIALDGNSKMSASGNSVIFMSDTIKSIKKKIMKAFSGGLQTIEEHRLKGANLKTDVAYQYLRYFEFDDKKLKKIGKEYGEGKLLSGQVKKLLIDKIVPFIKEYQQERKTITNEDIKLFYSLNKFS